MSQTVIVVGAGRIGTYLASLLVTRGAEVRIVEQRADVAAALDQTLPGVAVLRGSGTDPAVLEAAHIREASVVAAMTGDDDVNLVVTSLARFEFGVPRTVARIIEPRNAWMFVPEMGVDAALNQADLMAWLIAEEISVGDVRTLLKLHKGEYSLVEERVHSAAAAAGRALKDVDLPAECVLAAVIRDGHLLVPKGDTVLRPGDEVLAVVHAGALPRLATLLGPSPS